MVFSGGRLVSYECGVFFLCFVGVFDNLVVKMVFLGRLNLVCLF